MRYCLIILGILAIGIAHLEAKPQPEAEQTSNETPVVSAPAAETSEPTNEEGKESSSNADDESDDDAPQIGKTRDLFDDEPEDWSTIDQEKVEQKITSDTEKSNDVDQEENRGNFPSNEYVLSRFEDLSEALKHKKITVRDLNVPANKVLDFNLISGSILTFTGKITFGFSAWEGPLVRIGGKYITVVGKPGNLLDGEGKRWWDGKGGNGGITKPKFLHLRLKYSTVRGLNLKNSPVHGISINSCVNLIVDGINFDNSAGAYPGGGHNTDAFDVGLSENIVIKNSNVVNQDDCLAINSGTYIVFDNNRCSGGHGISIGSVGGRKSNIVKRVIVTNSVVADSDNGIRIKTVSNAQGSVSDVTFRDITFKNIRKVGITIQGNYLNGGPKGEPTTGVPITGLTIANVHGNVLPSGTNYLVWVANASNWKLDSNQKVEGGQKARPCKGFPNEVNHLC